jgi:hypothetical protein
MRLGADNMPSAGASRVAPERYGLLRQIAFESIDLTSRQPLSSRRWTVERVSESKQLLQDKILAMNLVQYDENFGRLDLP